MTDLGQWKRLSEEGERSEDGGGFWTMYPHVCVDGQLQSSLE